MNPFREIGCAKVGSTCKFEAARATKVAVLGYRNAEYGLKLTPKGTRKLPSED